MIRHKNVEYFNLVHAQSQIAIPNCYPKLLSQISFVHARFLSFLQAFLLSLPSAFHILSGCRKKFG